MSGEDETKKFYTEERVRQLVDSAFKAGVYLTRETQAYSGVNSIHHTKAEAEDLIERLKGKEDLFPEISIIKKKFSLNRR